ncbi:DMT family transporter [Burkholderia ubonensis]|uniref:DMT family transporter n=1 Tax=Burkholderia ubonensis TaxID=101571 RepID=UPI002ABDDA50|nr:DMT family transporter [Burkholderia ubonensis]
MNKDIGPLPYLAGGLAVAIWGATPAATAILAREIPPIQIGITRLAACATILVPIALVFKPKLPNDRSGWGALLVSALLGFFGSFMLQGLGIPRTSTTHAALILTLTPVFTAIIQFILSKRWPKSLWWIGSTIALSGVATLVLGRNLAGGGNTSSLWGDAIVLVGAITVSIGYVAGARLSARIGLFAATTWSLLIGAAITLPALPTMVEDLAPVTLVGWTALFILAVLCTLIGYAAWFWALDQGGVASIAPLQFGQPVVSLIIAVTILSESLSATIALALCLILGGVYLSRRAL